MGKLRDLYKQFVICYGYDKWTIDLEISFGVENVKISPINTTRSSIQLMEIYLITCGMEDDPMYGNLEFWLQESWSKNWNTSNNITTKNWRWLLLGNNINEVYYKVLGFNQTRCYSIFHYSQILWTSENVTWWTIITRIKNPNNITEWTTIHINQQYRSSIQWFSTTYCSNITSKTGCINGNYHKKMWIP